VIIITLSLVFAISFLMIGIKGIYRDLFTEEAKSKYPNIDIVISYDEYSLTRFINKRNVLDRVEEINYALAFFNLQVLTEIDDKFSYSKMISGMNHELEILLDEDIDISNNKAVISEYYAKVHGLSIGDSFSFFILDNEFEYEVGLVISDNKVFGKEGFFVNKNSILSQIYSLGFLENFGNEIYINTSSIDSVYDSLRNDDLFKDYRIQKVVDNEIIEGIVNEYTSMIAVAGIIVVFALIIVLDSLLPIILNDIYLEIGVMDTLGDKKKTGRSALLWQWIIYIVISFMVALIISHIVIRIGTNIYGVGKIILINPLVLLLCFVGVSILILFKNAYLLSKHKKKDLISKIRDHRYILAGDKRFLIILLLILQSITMIFKPFALEYNSLIIVLLSLFISLELVILILKIILIRFRSKNSVFGLFNSKYMIENKYLHQSIRVLFVSLIVIVIMLTVRLFIAQEIDKVRKDNKFDIMIVNIYDYEDSLLDELNEYDIEDIDRALLYSNVIGYFPGQNKELIRNFVSMELSEFNKYFDYILDDIPEVYKTNHLPYIVLPKAYSIVYGLDLGDVIKFDLAQDLNQRDFVIAGFIDTNFDHIIYSNLYEKSDDLNLKFNAVFINSANPITTIDSLIKDYSAKMYYVIDGQVKLDNHLELADNVLALFTVIIVFVMISFVFVLINNTLLKFNSLKNSLAKIKLLGVKNKSILKNTMIEMILVFVVLIIVGLLEIIILSNHMKYLTLFFDYYKDLYASVHAVVLGYIIVLVSLLISFVYYYRLHKDLNMVNEIKTF